MNGNAVKFGDNTYPAKIWDLIIDGCICINNTFSIDTETTLIEPGQTPDYVIGTCFNGKTVYLLKRESVSEFVELHKNCIWFFHNAAFDIAVIERLTNFRFYKLIENHRIIDTAILYRLIRIAKAGHPNGQYNLGYLSFEYLDIELPKKELDEEGNEIRKNFGKFLNSDLTVDYERIPEQYYQYALLDAIATYFLAEKLIFEADDIIKKFKLPTRFGLLTHQIQLMGDYALYKISQNGMCIDTELVDNVCNELQQHQQEYLKILNTYEYYPKQKNNKKVLDKILRNIEITHSIFLPNTVSGKYKSAKEDILKEYTHLNFIYEYIEYHKCNKLINTFLNKFNIKKVYPNYRLIVATGRTSCSKPNVQNLPRKGRTREVFIPTEGYLLLAVDYSQIELITLALIIFKKFGSSKMLEIINSGQDLHIWFAALIYNKSISDITAEERQTAKSANFGFPGGLGIKSFIQFAKNTYGIILTEQQAKDLKEKWLKNFPEMRNYLENDFITKFRKKYDLSDYYTQTKKDNEYAVYTLKGIISGLNKTKTTEREYTQEEKDWAWSKIEEIEFEGKEKFTGEIYTKTGSPKLARALFEGNLTAETLTGRIRSNITFCASRNTPFQGLAADGAKIALYRLIKRGYRVVAFIHDEVIIELPIENCNHREEAEKISKIMIDSMNIVCPDVKVKTEYVLMKRWIKEAKATFDTEGRLIPYEKKF